MAVAQKKDYEAIARDKIKRPSEIPEKEKFPRLLVYGRNKKGKTTFCSSASNVLIIDPEEGTKYLTKTDPHVWRINKWEEMDEVEKFLRLGKHDYQWVALDPMTRIHNMALRWVMNQANERSLDSRPVMVDKRFHGQAGEMTKQLLWNFHSLPMGVIYTAQERIEAAIGMDDDEDADDAATSFVPDLPKGARNAVNSIVDVIGRIYVVKTDVKFRNPTTKQVEEKTVLQRRLWLEPHPAYDTGYRSEYVNLPQYLKNPTVPKLLELISTGKVSTSGNQTQ
jgi:hypothetical protein